MIRNAVLLSLWISLFATAATPLPKREGFEWKGLALLAIQDRGRLKPLDTFASDSVLFVTGKRSYQGLSAIEVLFSWLFLFEQQWDARAFVKIDHNELKKKIGLDASQKYFAPKDLRGNAALGLLVRQAAAKNRDKESLTAIEKKAVTVQNQLGLLSRTASGESLNLFPNPRGINEPWISLSEISKEGAQLPYTAEQNDRLINAIQKLVQAHVDSSSTKWNSAVAELISVIKTDLGKGGLYPAESALELERHYNHLRPFRWSWVLYTLAFIFFCMTQVSKNKLALRLATTTLLAGFLLHSYGFVVRCLVAERPPVTNMYESVIWVTWGTILFALIIGAIYKKTLIPASATVFAVAGLVLADNLPLVLDPGIHPLEPVLRSNFWLTIHVLTITLSYAAYALSLCIGNVVLGHYLFRPNKVQDIQYLALYMYRAMQIGTILLAAGTILGGVWADYSWGRFWGWDPKEVWALIALLLYIAVLHGRMAGWLKGFGFTATTVLSFLGVLMAWYGVNFVLGVGLHSYGFGTGGSGYVLTYIALQLTFIGLAYLRYRQTGSDKAAPIFPRKGSSR